MLLKMEKYKKLNSKVNVKSLKAWKKLRMNFRLFVVQLTPGTKTHIKRTQDVNPGWGGGGAKRPSLTVFPP